MCRLGAGVGGATRAGRNDDAAPRYAMTTRVTAKDVARRVGVSRSTVSRTFTPGAIVKPETRAAIEAAAVAMGYLPNPLARALIRRRSNFVAIAQGDLLHPFHATLTQALMETLQREDIDPITVMIGGDRSLEALRRVVEGYQVAAIVITSIQVDPAIVRASQALGAPVILFNRIVSSPPVTSVSTDLEQGGMLAGMHVVERGARRVAIVCGTAGTPSAVAREAGFRAGVAAAGGEVVGAVPGDYTYAAGLRAGEALFSNALGAPFEAVLCANDHEAIGVLDAMRARSLRAPRDALVVGFDDIPNSAWRAYDLTSVRLPVEAMLEAGAAHIRSAVVGKAPAATSQLLPCTLSVRGSTGGAAATAGAGPARTDGKKRRL